MKILKCVVSAAVSAVLCGAASAAVNWETSLDNVMYKAKQSKKPVLVCLYSEAPASYEGTEPWLTRMDENTFTSKEVEKILTEKFVCIRLSAALNPDLSSKYDARDGALVFTDFEGKQLEKVSGYKDAKEFMGILDKILNPAPEQAPTAGKEKAVPSAGSGTEKPKKKEHAVPETKLETINDVCDLEKNKPVEFALSLPAKQKVFAKVYDKYNNLVNTIVGGELEAGKNTIKWDGTRTSGKTVAAGEYSVEFSAGSFKKEIKVSVKKPYY